MNVNQNRTIETPLQKEKLLFKELSARLIDALLNRVFDLRPEKARNRMTYLTFLFLIAGFIISMIVSPEYSLAKWIEQIRTVFRYLLDSEFALTAASQGKNYINDFILFVWNALTSPRTLQYLPIFLAPFFIALHSAALYLDDIFELGDISIARKFINEVALTGSDDTIRITAGSISEQDRQSPNYLIGGPGKVMVDLDSAALFERPDGTPHVIGPTGKERGGKATIEGFERFRQAVDLRDHFVEWRDQDSKSSAVGSRSLDGIPVAATDVRLVFSVHRNGEVPTKEKPYPFSEKAIERFVYGAASRVTPEMSNPSTYEFAWMPNIIGLVRGQLANFMSQHPLTAYLANIGIPEVEKAKERELSIVEKARQLIPPSEIPPSPQPVSPPSAFKPRYEIKNLFNEFAKSFTSTARDRGVELHWIGLGVWKTPIENVFEKHLDAWILSHENMLLGSDESMNKLQFETETHKMVATIQNLPILAYQTAVENYSEREHVIKELLLEYQRFLKDQLESYQKSNIPVNPTVVTAIFHIDSLISHKLYPTPPETETGGEKELYRNLLARVRIPEAIEKLVSLEKELDPQASRSILLERIIKKWDLETGIDSSDGPHSTHWVGESPSKDQEIYSKKGTASNKSPTRYLEDSLYQELIQLVGGDSATADRLIELERIQFPSESRLKLIERAIERLTHDRR